MSKRLGEMPPVCAATFYFRPPIAIATEVNEMPTFHVGQTAYEANYWLLQIFITRYN